ncbi:MAG: DUF748 domain-containing protein, partial [Deefgea sp.]
MTTLRTFFQWPRWSRFIVYFIAAAALFGALGAWAVPAILRPWLADKASEALNRPVAIGAIKINPYLLQVTLRDVVIKDQFGEFASFKSLLLDIEMASIFRLAPVLRAITLEQANVNVIRLSANQYNFTDLLVAKHKDPSESSELPRFSLNNIQLINGRVQLDDRFIGQKQQLDQLNFALPFLSTLPNRIDEYIQPHFSGRFNGRPFALQGESKPFKDSLDTILKLKIDQQDLTPLLGYAALPQGLQISSAKLSSQLDLTFRQQKNRAELVLNGHVILDDVVAMQQSQPLLALKKLDVELKSMQPLVQQFRFGKIALNGLDVTVSRDDAMILNWQKFASKADTKPTLSASAVAKTAENKMLFEVAEFNLTDSQLRWIDAGVKP